jgi:hypothetical protein
MQVEYVITPDDFVVLAIHSAERMPLRRRHPFFPVCLSLLALSLACNILTLPGALAGLYSVYGLPWTFLLSPALLIWMGVLFLTWRTRLVRRTRRALRGEEYAPYLGWQHLVIDAEGLTQANEDVSITMKWARVTSIDVATDHAFFYGPSGGAFIPPKRPFPSKDAFAEFVATATRYREAAQKSAPAAPLVAPKRANQGDDRITLDERADC